MLIDILDFANSTYGVHLTENLVDIPDWFGLLVEYLDPLLDGLLVVVLPPGCETSNKQSFLEDLLRDIEVEDVVDFSEFLFEEQCLAEGSGESINEISLSFGVLHFLDEQAYGQFRRYNLAFFD